MATEIPPDHDLDRGQIDLYLKAYLPDLEGWPEIEKINGGQSNLTYFVSYGKRHLILRRRPDGKILPSAHAVDREFRVQKALQGKDVRVPKMLLYEDDVSIAGTAFYVMEKVNGRIFHDNMLTEAPKIERLAMYKNLAAMLANIHSVDVGKVGLSDYGQHGGYFARQIARWSKQWQASRSRELPSIDHLMDWLPRHLPEDDLTTLVHGDFRTGNVIFHPTGPSVVAVLDWELSTLGHPMADLAHSCAYIWMMDCDEFGVGLRDVDLEYHGLPTMPEFVSNYAIAIGQKIELTTFHLAFALFRLAVIFEGIADRARRGNAASDNAEDVGRIAPELAKRGAQLARGAPAVIAY
ncbi:MAG: phosphotransferase family protein [Rhodobacterales bacterium]